MQDKEMGGWGEKVKRSPVSDLKRNARRPRKLRRAGWTPPPSPGPLPRGRSRRPPAVPAPARPDRQHKETTEKQNTVPGGGRRWAGWPERAPRAPTAGVQPGRGGAPEAPRARSSSKCLRTCHPSPPRSIFPSRRGRGTRARTGGRSRGGQRRAMAGVRRGPAATSRRPAPAPRAAIVPALPPPATRPPAPRAPAPTRGRGSRRRGRRRRRHNNINTAGPPARPLRRPPRLPAAQRTATRGPGGGTGAVRAVAAAVTQRCPRLGFLDRVVRPRPLR